MGVMPPVTSPADADHDNTAPTDLVDTSTGQSPDTEAREARRGAADIAQRLLHVLPALRTGALLSVIGAVVLFFAWPSSARTAPLWGMPPAVIGAFWFMTIILRPLPSRFRDPVHGSRITVIRTAIAILAISGITAFAVWVTWTYLSTWSSVLSHTGINAVELVAIAVGAVGLALLSITDILIRTLQAAILPPELYRGKWWTRLRRSRRPVQHPEDPRRRALTRAALVLAPSVILAGAAALPLSRSKRVIQKLAAPSVAKNLPAYTTSLASKPAWVKDIDNVLDIAAGAAGPVIHTADGITGINPLDGSTLWTYARKGAAYEKFLDPISEQAGKNYPRTLTISPDHHHIVFRISDPGKVKHLPFTDLIKHNTDGGITWAATITPSVADMISGEITTPQKAAKFQLLESTSGYAVVSPDGRHASFLLRPADMLDPYDAREAGRDFTIADQRTYILVIETETGKTVRTEEVKGLILGQVLTNDTLAVETSQAYYPGGNGHGTITTYALDKPTAKAATIPTDKWLVGATQDSLLLAPSNMSGGHDSAQPLTRLSEGGDVVGTIGGVTDVYRGGWVGRVTDPSTPPPQDTSSPPQAVPTELVHLDSGVTTDVAGLKVEEVALPTASGLLVSREASTGEGQKRETTSTPQFWLSAADDGHRHTENLEQFTSK